MLPKMNCVEERCVNQRCPKFYLSWLFSNVFLYGYKEQFLELIQKALTLLRKQLFHVVHVCVSTKKQRY